jgi:hypothetical protein
VGTSSSYKGSSGKIPKAMREGFDNWAKSQTKSSRTKLPEDVVAQALLIPRLTSPTRAAGASGSREPGSQTGRQSSPHRDVASYASTASWAAELAHALRAGDQGTFGTAGLNFDTLSALTSRAEVGRAIVDFVCAANPGSDIASEEQRALAGKLVDWMQDASINPEIPTPAEITEYAIALIAMEIHLSELGDSLRGREGLSREEQIAQIHETSRVLAARANIANGPFDRASIETAINRGVRKLRKIYKPRSET